MDGFLKKRVKGFLFHINKSYEAVVEESFLNTLADDACQYAVQKYDGALRKESTLPNRTPVYLKYWKPRKTFHRIKTIWHPTRIEVEGTKYPCFTSHKLPVPDMVLWGSQRIPQFKFGIFNVGLIVTRKIEEGADLDNLLKQNAQPWINNNNSHRFAVLKNIAQLLHAIHKKNLIHGDYVLRNIVYAKNGSNGKYWIIDLGSGCSLSPGNVLHNSHPNHDLDRMVYDLARKGFSRDDALFFIKSYICCENDNNQFYSLARQCPQACLSQNGHRTLEAMRYFDQTDRHKASSSLRPTE